MPTDPWRSNNLDAARRISRESAVRCRVRNKTEMIAAYGGACTCCGETRQAFLSMDHVNGRTQEDDLRGEKLWRYARNLGWPAIFTVLCHNCNLGRQINGGICPHKDSDA